MTLEEIVNIYKNSSLNIININNKLYLKKGFVLYSFPTLYDYKLEKKDIHLLKWRSLISIIKINSKIKNTYEYILDTDDYNLETFSSKTRNQIRKSLKECNFKRPSFNDMIEYAFNINILTLQRHSRNEKFLTNKKLWKNYIVSLYNNPNVIILGAYINEFMVGYIICYKFFDKYTILHPFIDKKYSSSAPMNGLIYKLVNQILENEGAAKISYGLESFKNIPSLNKFKKSMRFVPVPSTRVYIINPLIYIFLKLIIIFYIIIFNKSPKYNDNFNFLIKIYQGSRILKKLYL
ncbi:MAG TPA: hypothetical protein PLQ41_06135 [bacterium]|nr:hypothetical protein [bacterium]